MKYYGLILFSLFMCKPVWGDDYLYNYRYGADSPYGYNYDVIGTDENGNEVIGNIDTQGKYGSGVIVDSNGEEVEIDTEWIDNGVMEAQDANGNMYELEVE